MSKLRLTHSEYKHIIDLDYEGQHNFILKKLTPNISISSVGRDPEGYFVELD